uniref:NADH-ubiquinone oxidoreductase chain 2 n=1 Tax=Bipes tridactylus TaxID=273520 RepID=Q66SS2_9SAUR|nr:NADH dehydrogenase subunit 2 [Bipes tridactylus]AAT08543.1 NADH dehydrogenase subunit 2 [Bipes tridactylus]
MNPHMMALMATAVATGTLIVSMSSHWLLAWAALELNTMAILPLLTQTHSPRTAESATKYFLIQTTASTTLLFSSTMNAWFTGQWSISQLTTDPTSTMMTLALLMKLGVAPLHAWLPEVMQGTSTAMSMIIATWQKIAPFLLLYTISHNTYTMVLLPLALLSTTLGGWGGLNQTQIRKMMAFSSIAHLGWAIATLTFNQALPLLALITYFIMTINFFSIVLMTSTKTIKDSASTWSSSPHAMLLMLMSLLSLGGLPPLSGFMPKILIMKELIELNLTLTATAMATTSLLSLAFYVRLAYSTSLTLAPTPSTMKMEWRLAPGNHTIHTAITTTMTTMLLPLTPIIIPY